MLNRRQIEQAITVLEAEPDQLDPPVAAASLEALRRQLHRLEQQEITTSAMQGERRHVTVMFADISGFTAMSEKLDPEEVRNMINACFERLGEVVDRYGGHIDKFIGDEIMALFGAPIAHENDPERTLRAALDMMAALESFNQEHAAQLPRPLALHFGVNSGLVIAGGIGTQQRRDYSVMGDTVNLAARLEDLSESGEILVGEDTYRLTAPLFEFEALKPVKLKGKAKPVRVYRLLKARSRPGGQIRGIEGLFSPLVGRQEELAALKQILSTARQGQGGLVSVVGEAGLGKSRLVEELRASCLREGGAEWADGRALSYGESASYLVARDALRNMLGVAREAAALDVEVALRNEIERCLPQQAADLYPYLAHLLDAPLDEAAVQRIKYLEGEALHQRILQAARQFLEAITRNAPLVLVWEDLHWADPSSLELLETLLPLTQDCSLLLVLIYRPPFQNSRISRFDQRLSEELGQARPVIELTPLSSEESYQLLDNLLGSAVLPEKIRRLIVTKAEGNPFYIEEVIRSLIDSEALVYNETEQCWTVAPGLDDIKLPNTLQGVIMARIDQLQPDTKRLLQVASVMGRKFSYRLLEQVLNGRPTRQG